MSDSWPTTFLKDGEEAFLKTLTLPTKTPYVIRGVRNTQLSIARFSGGIVYNGDFFTYVPHTDELIREDVVTALMTRREKLKRAADRAEDAKQADLFKPKPRRRKATRRTSKAHEGEENQ